MPGRPGRRSQMSGPTRQIDISMLAQKIDEYIQMLMNHPEPKVREATHQMLDGIDSLHREAFGRIIVGLSEHPELRDRITEDPVVSMVFELYGLLKVDEAAVVDQALEAVRPYIQSHGGEVEVLGVEDGVVRVRLAGSCHGCAGSTVTLKRGIEAALREGLPGFKKMVVEESVAHPPAAHHGHGGTASNFIPLTAVSAPKRPIFQDALPLAELAPGKMRGVVLGDTRVLLVNVDGDIFAYRNACLESPLPLDLGTLEGHRIRCPWHQCLFDARTGRALEPLEGQIDPFPVALQDGRVRVATNAPGLSLIRAPATA